MVADGGDHLGTQRGFAADGGDTEELAAGFSEEVSESEGVVDVGADIGVKEDLLSHGVLWCWRLRGGAFS